MKSNIVLTGATGAAGSRILLGALARGHRVTALVRDPAKLPALPLGQTGGLTTTVCDLGDMDAVAAAMAGHDVAINAAGYVTDGEAYRALVAGVIRAAEKALGPGGRFWAFGGAAALDIPGGGPTLDLPQVPRVFEAHAATLAALQATALDWSLICPGPMIDAPDGQARTDLRLSADVWPTDGPATPDAALMAFFGSIPQMTISYQDAAAVILDHLEPSGSFACRRVGIALPVGMVQHKTS